MKKLAFIVVLLSAAVVLILAANPHFVSPPRLVILFSGKPASGVNVRYFGNGLVPATLDANGVLQSPHPGEELFVFVPVPHGGESGVTMPKHGTRIIDLYPHKTTTTETKYFGFEKSTWTFYPHQFSDKELDDIRSGRRTADEIVRELEDAAANSANKNGNVESLAE